jgi:nitroreductase
MMPDPRGYLAADRAIRERKTTKVLAVEDLPASDSRELLDDLLGLAGMAPFHRACDVVHREDSADLRGLEPWRFYAITSGDCRRLRNKLPAENAGKIPAMLAAADALLLATWLPNPPSADFQRRITTDREAAAIWSFEPTLGNMEHIAATSAAIQNLLLAATARGIRNYWSSGGVLRTPEIFQELGISVREILLGAIFLFPLETADSEVVGSKLREHRSAPEAWSRRLKIH